MEHIKNALAGGFAGLITDGVIYPLDMLKTRIQAKTSVSFFKLTELYKGILPTLIGTIPATATFYCFYELMKRNLSKKNISHNYVYLISTLAAEVTSCFVRLPFEIVKQRMQVDTTNNSMMNFVSEVTGDNNLKSFLFRSYVITLLREIPFNCIEFFLWENFQKSAKRKFTNFANKYPSVTSAFCGGVAAAISGFLTTPIDVVKSRQMIYGRSFQETISEMYDEGIGSFYRGWYFRSTYLFMGGIVFFGSLNLMSRCLRTNTQVEKT